MKRFLYLGLAALVALALAGCTPPVDPLSTTAEMTDISLRQALNAQLDRDYSGVQNPLTKNFTFEALPTGVDISSLIPSFTLSAGASAKIGAAAQTSGVSVVDFSSDVTYRVTAENGTTTKDYVVHVEAPSLGFTSFSIAVPGMGDMELIVDNDAGTITGEIPYTYRAALDSELIVSFAHNGTGVWFTDSPLTELMSGVAPLDFSAATGQPSWSIDLRNGTEISKTYTVTVTAAATASADADLASFSVVYDTVTYDGVIAGTTVTLPLLPPSANLAALTVDFAMNHVGAVLKDGATTLASGTSTVDLSADRTLTGVAEDGTMKDYTIVKPDNTPAMAVVAFDSNATSDNLKWIEVKVIDKTRVTGVARLVATGEFENTLIPDFTALPIWANVVDGDVIRIWDAYALKTSDTVKSDNSPAVWDQLNLEAGKYNLGEKYGALVLDIGGTPINYVAYSVDTNTSWTVKASMTAAVTAKLWPSTARDTAYNPVTYTAGCYYQLAAGFTHGVSAAAWERATGQEFWTLSGAAASLQVNAGTGGDVTFSVTPVYTGTGTHSMTSLKLDVTPLDSELADPNLVMADADVDGTYTLDYTVPSTVSSGYKSLRFRAETVVNGVTLLDTATTLGYTVLGPKDFTIDSASADTTLVIYSVPTPVNFNVGITPINIAAVDSVTADLSGLGGSTTEAFADLDENDVWTLAYEIPATVAAGTYPVTVTATVLGENGTADIVKTDSSISITVSDDPLLVIDSASVTPELVIEGNASALSVTASTSGINGATATDVTVDYTALGGGVVSATDSGGGVWTDTSFTVPDTQAAGTYTITITAIDSVNSLEVVDTVSFMVLPLAFVNSDMENGGPAGIVADASISTTEFYEGLASYHYAKNVTSSATVPITTTKFNAIPAGMTKLVFWFKGTTSGTAPGLRIQVASGGTVANYYDINGIVSGTTLTRTVTTGGSYSTTPINVTEWTRVELDLTGVAWDVTPTDGIDQTIVDYAFTFRVRSPSSHDWYIDGIHFE